MDKFPQCVTQSLKRVHPEFLPIVLQALDEMAAKNPTYFQALEASDFLPTDNRLFAAFSQSPENISHILIGEGPYPRPASATGVAFMDGAVGNLWSENGLSKPVNRATSLRNFMKMLLVARGDLLPGQTKGEDLKRIAEKAQMQPLPYIQTIDDLQSHLEAAGFLLLNAALVFRTTVSAAKESDAWYPFMYHVLEALANRPLASGQKRTLVLWGKMAQKCLALPFVDAYTCAVSEHPYNISFINNPVMQALFAPMDLLNNH